MKMEGLLPVILLMALVTYLPRVLPALFLSRVRLPRFLERWLASIPVAVLAALLAPALFAPEGHLETGLAENPGLWISLPVFLVAFLTRNLFATVVSGMALMALGRFLL